MKNYRNSTHSANTIRMDTFRNSTTTITHANVYKTFKKCTRFFFNLPKFSSQNVKSQLPSRNFHHSRKCVPTWKNCCEFFKRRRFYDSLGTGHGQRGEHTHTRARHIGLNGGECGGRKFYSEISMAGNFDINFCHRRRSRRRFFLVRPFSKIRLFFKGSLFAFQGELFTIDLAKIKRVLLFSNKECTKTKERESEKELPNIALCV